MTVTPTPTLGELRATDSIVFGECLECGRRKHVDLSKLPLPDDVLLSDAGYKLRCTDCKAKRILLTVKEAEKQPQ